MTDKSEALAALLEQFAESLVEDTTGDRMKLKLITAERDKLAGELKLMSAGSQDLLLALNAERERADVAESEVANFQALYQDCLQREEELRPARQAELARVAFAEQRATKLEVLYGDMRDRAGEAEARYLDLQRKVRSLLG
jgi:hypothetical protein